MSFLDDGTRYAMAKYPTDGTTTDWEINFVGGYLSQDDVYAYSYPEDDRNDTIAHPLTFVSEAGDSATVRITPAVAAGRILVIARLTQRGDPLVDFINRSMLTAANLNTITEQAIYSVAEIQDMFAELELGVSEDVSGIQALAAQAAADAAAAEAAAATAQATANGAVATANAALAAAESAEAAIGAATDAADAATAAALAATTAANEATAALDDIEEDVQGAVDTANDASAQAQAAADVALGLGDEIDTANENATLALNTANAIDAKAQAALDNSTAALAAAEAAPTDAEFAALNADAVKKSVTADQIMQGELITVLNMTARHDPGAGTWYYRMENAAGTLLGGLLLHDGGMQVRNESGALLALDNNDTWAIVGVNSGSIAGSLAVSTSISSGTGVFSGNTATVFANAGVGNMYFRPQGAGVASAEMSLTAAGTLNVNGELRVQGSNAILYSYDRGTGRNWGWYGLSDLFRLFNGSTDVAQFNPSGNFHAFGQISAAGGFQPGSSKKVKTQLRKVKGALAKLAQLEFVTGKYRRDFVKLDGGNRRKFFALAEQAAPIAPELVTPDVFDYKGEKVPAFDYDGLAVLNSAAIQELLTIIQHQQEQIDELKELL